MSINHLLSELVVIANSLDKRECTDVAADLDAAIFILSSEDALPLNKSLASMAREYYAATNQEDTEEELEASAISCVGEVMSLTDNILDLDPRVRIAILQSLIQGMKSMLNPGATLTKSSLEQGAELLAEAERKLSQDGSMEGVDGLHGVGYRVGVIRSKLESSNDG